MDRVHRFVLVALATIVLASPAVAQDRKALEELLPQETLALVTIHDLEQFRSDFESTGLFKIWAEPEIQSFFDSIWGGLKPLYDDWVAEMKEESGVDLDEVFSVLRGEIAVAFTGMDRETGMPGLVFSVEAKDNLPAAVKIIAQLREKIASENKAVSHTTRQVDGITIETFGDDEFRLHYTAVAGGFYFATSESAIDALVEAHLGGGGANLTGAPSFGAIRKRLALAGEDYLLYVDLAGLLRTFGEEMPDEARQALEASGLLGWESIGLAGEFTENQWKESVAIHAPGERQGLSTIFDGAGKVDLSAARMVPGHAAGYSTVRFDATHLYDEMLASIDRFDASAGEDIREGIQEFESRFNVGLRDDVLGSLGGEIHGFSFEPDGGSLIPHSVGLIRLADGARFQSALDKVLSGQEMLEAKEVAYRGRTIHYLVSPLGDLGEDPFEGMESEAGAMMTAVSFAFGSMCWYVEDGWLVYSGLTQSLKDYVDFREDGQGSLADSSDFQAAAARAGDGAVAFMMSDLRPMFAKFYNTGLPVLKMIEGFARRAGVAMDVALLPRSKTVTAHMAPTCYVVTTDGSGVTISGVSLFPGTLLGLSTASVVAAVAIPSIVQARTGANEASAIGILRSLSTSQEMFRESVIVDADGDGNGEYGFIQELSGVDSRGERVDPPFMSQDLGRSAAANDGVFEKSGYYFRIFLPGTKEAMPEKGKLPRSDRASADSQETRWIAYAWPVDFEKSGRRVFVMNQDGQVYETHNYGTMYSGLENQPSADAALDLDDGNASNLESRIADGGGRSGDGNFWFPSGG